MNRDERISTLEKENAVLKEKISRLETIVYGVIGFVLLQLLGLFILWAKEIMDK